MSMRARERYFEELGDDFDAFMSDYDVERRRSLIFERLLCKRSLSGLRVLEVGCGTGRFSEPITMMEANLTALDIGPGLARRVHASTGAQGIAADACALPFADACFDGVISSECIEHTPRPFAVIGEMCRVCRPGGFVCFTTPNRLWLPVLLAAQSLGLRKFSGYENWIWPGEAKVALKKQGLDNIRAWGCHAWPFQFRFTRPVLRRLDRFGSHLYPVMINFGLIGEKPLSND